MMITKPKILFVTARIPAPGIYGDQLRSWSFLETMAERFAVTLVCLDNGAIPDADVERVSGIVDRFIRVPHSGLKSVTGALRFLATGRPAQVGWFHSNALCGELEHLVATGNYCGAFVQLARLHSLIPSLQPLPVVLDFVDALSMQWKRRVNSGSIVHRLFNRIESKRMAVCERELLESCHTCVVTSRDDANHLEHLHELAVDVHVVPNGVDMNRFHPIPTTDETRSGNTDRPPVVLFSGNLDYVPNRQAVQYFTETVLPLLRQKRPDLRFVAAGKVTNKDLLSLADSHQVEFTGYVDDLGKEIASADVVVTPMISGAGIQNKVLEAMATGTPVVSTRLANAGIGAAHGKEIMIGAAPESLTCHVMSLLTQPGMAQKIGDAGRHFVRENFSWQAQAGVVADHLEEATTAPVVNTTLPVSSSTGTRLSDFTRRLRLSLRVGRNFEDLAFRTLTRTLHLAVSSLILSGFLLLLPLLGLLIKIDSPGSIFYSQRRVGINRRHGPDPEYSGTDRRNEDLGGRIFNIWKLRTMTQDAEQDTGPVWARKEDPRVTRIGKILRKTRLDEIPQLWNVLRGEMSLVGPRPERPFMVKKLARIYPGYHSRLSGFKPGITGLAQIQGVYDTHLDKVDDKLVLDHGYRLRANGARNRFLVDLQVIMLTVPTVVTGKGAH